ncbi:primosomal protein N' [Klugiella xanthotipulae]|uniref:Probable replication restart protein PriA n=1 Tax=Klugiella xanthotipulae TaxID=244735 RepID=A0A543HSA9_9MICO|nr:primosomal protein N' [Klugiella xanthotipulae]TQM61228.1 replication restart DNA helicase PriA [Klugiella xanthotipulae]
MVTGPVARVLLDSALPQLDHLFDYAIPHSLVGRVRPGVRVRVPFRSAARSVGGYVIEVTDTADFSGELSLLSDVVSDIPVLTPEIWALTRTLADRAAGSVGDILRLAIPPRQVRVEKQYLAAIDADLPSEVSDSTTGPDGPAGSESDAYSADDIRLLSRYDPEILTGLASAHRFALGAIPGPQRLPSGEWVGDWALTLATLAVGTYHEGRSVIIALPDYRDLDQIFSALQAVLDSHRAGSSEAALVRVDAKQTNAERYRSFLRLLGDEPRIIVGNRSAVYAPASRLGAIFVWDDGDSLHEEPLSPYVHTRDAALVRAEQAGCGLVFAAHTRSTEVQRLVDIAWLREAQPLRRPEPRVILSSLSTDQEGGMSSARIPTIAWLKAKEAAAVGPVLIQVARPGYSPVLACGNCREAARCHTCQGPLGVRRAGETPRCAWCGTLARHWACRNCGSSSFRLISSGSGRTAEELEKAFPGVRVLVSDSETIRQSVDSRPSIVVATRGAEPTAAGGYAAVILLDGERMLGRESLRTGEDCLRWWSNAVALARPGAPCVLVGVTGPLGSALSGWRQPDYARAELADRRELRFPPSVRIATITGSREAVEAAVDSVIGIAGVDALGPTSEADGSARSIIRFGYRNGEAVASTLRAQLVATAIKNRRPRKMPGSQGATPPLFRLKLDDADIR